LVPLGKGNLDLGNITLYQLHNLVIRVSSKLSNIDEKRMLILSIMLLNESRLLLLFKCRLDIQVWIDVSAELVSCELNFPKCTASHKKFFF
jgi:hypothetical protein